MNTVKGREAIRVLTELREQVRMQVLRASEYHQTRQEVESCYGATARPTYVPRIRMILDLHEGVPTAPECPSALVLGQVLDSARTGALRNLRVDVNACGEGSCRGMRLVLWYDDESDAILAMCA